MKYFKLIPTFFLVATFAQAACRMNPDPPILLETCPTQGGSGGSAGSGGGTSGDGGSTSSKLPVGSKCGQDSECGGYDFAKCVTSIKPLEGKTDPTNPDSKTFENIELPFTGGYCSSDIEHSCTADSACGTGGACYIPFEGVTKETLDSLASANLPFDIYEFAKLGICLKPCTDDTECRTEDGYKCQIPLGDLAPLFNPMYMKTFCVEDPNGLG
jgi:hypothetical protein